MNAVAIKNSPGTLVQHQPSETHTNQAKTDALIAFAKQTKDWPLLEDAVDAKLDDQEEFVQWWTDNVRRAGNQTKNAGLGFLTVDEAEVDTGITQQQVSKWKKKLSDRPKYKAALFGAAWKKAMGEKGQTDQRGASGTGENEWYTPAEYLALARKVIGDFDLDPASSLIANEKVGAKQIYTEADNGLELAWHGAVWLNPPYAQPAIGQFIDKAVSEYAGGSVDAMIVLTHNYTDTKWFQQGAGAASAICFTRGRIKFESPSGAIAAPTQGQAFFYFGPDVALFHQHFAAIGFVVEVLK